MEGNFYFLFVAACLYLHVCFAQENTACSTEGEYFHNTQNCSTYLRCIHGIKKKMDCPAGTKFNLEWTTCVWPTDTDCEETSPNVTILTIEEQCKNNPSAILPHLTECQLFYNCSIVYGDGYRVFEQHMDECLYPDLFNTETLQCENFEDVYCGDRKEYVHACDYRRYHCQSSHCIPCRAPSCQNMKDGQNANKDRLWSPWYTECYKERAIEDKYCPPDSDKRTQIFHPLKKMCVPTFLVPKEHGGSMPVCKDKRNGNYNVENRCRSYVVCQNSEATETVTCDDDQVFDDVRKVCWDKKTACGRCGDVRQENCEI